MLLLCKSFILILCLQTNFELNTCFLDILLLSFNNSMGGPTLDFWVPKAASARTCKISLLVCGFKTLHMFTISLCPSVFTCLGVTCRIVELHLQLTNKISFGASTLFHFMCSQYLSTQFTNSVEHNPSWERNNCSANHGFIRWLWNSKIYRWVVVKSLCKLK